MACDLAVPLILLFLPVVADCVIFKPILMAGLIRKKSLHCVLAAVLVLEIGVTESDRWDDLVDGIHWVNSIEEIVTCVRHVRVVITVDYHKRHFLLLIAMVGVFKFDPCSVVHIFKLVHVWIRGVFNLLSLVLEFLWNVLDC